MTIKTSTDGGVTRVTLADPETRNAITGEDMIDELLDALDEAEENPDVVVAIIDAEGPAFSSGGNVKDMAAREGIFSGGPADQVEKYRDTIQQLTRFLATTDLVTIASVNGPAVGAGFDLVLGCDLRFGSRNAKFAHTFIEMGIIPGDGGAWLLPRVVGWQRATELALTARFITSAEAESYGILLEVVPEDRLDARVMEVARTIASKPRPAVVMAKRLLRQARSMDLDGFLEFSAAVQAVAHTTPEHETAVATYVEKLQNRD
ncbi:MAG TPA: enoyl-CoA hydratase-related protein [Acidimicrobiia bacterium]|nr:enoyl-CoA hydratase-related protein [Acidimicrobiia bacterium]